MFGQVWLIRTTTLLLAASVANSQWGTLRAIIFAKNILWQILKMLIRYIEAKIGRKDSSCIKPMLKNGKVKMRSSGRVVKFSCRSGYYIVGETTATCLRRQWTSEPPVCAGNFLIQ